MNEEIRQRTKWFMEDRFGMFIHWGLYSIPACGEWMMSQKEMTIEEYSKYFDQRIIGFSEIFLSVEMMTVGALSGLGRTQLCSLISVGLTVIRIPLALVLSNTALGLNGIWWALTLSTVSKGIIFYFVFQYICEHSLLRTTNR